MLSELTSNQSNLLPEHDRFYIPDPWEDTTEDFAKTATPAIVKTATNSVVATTATEASLHQLLPAASAVPNAVTTLLKDEPKLGRKTDPSFWMKMQEILAQLYWVDAICDG